MSETAKELCAAVAKAAQTISKERALKLEGIIQGYVMAVKDGEKNGCDSVRSDK